MLSKARARFGPEVFESFFRRSIDLCREAGLLEEGPVYVDSTLIQASASVDSMVRRDDLVQPPLSIEEYVQRLYRENSAAWRTRSRRHRQCRTLRQRRRRGQPSQFPRPNRALLSKTDPEATLVNLPEFGRHLAYKAHVAVAGLRGQVDHSWRWRLPVQRRTSICWRKCSGSTAALAGWESLKSWRTPSTARGPTTSTSNRPVSLPSSRPPASVISTRASGAGSTSPG